MTSATELSSLLADLYGAQLEPERWNRFLDRLCHLTSSSCGYVMGAYQEKGNVILAGGGQSHDAEFFRLYSEQYGSSDPFRPGLAKLPALGVNHGTELVDHAAVRKTEFYNDLLSEYDMEYMTLLLCNFSDAQTEGLSLWRSKNHPSMTKESEQLLEMLVPHLKIVLALRSKITSIRSVSLFSEAVMEAMSVAALLVDGKGRVHQMNRRAERCVAEGNGLQFSHGRLQAGDPQEQAQFQKLLQGVTSKLCANALPGGAMRVTRTDASPLHVSVVPPPKDNAFGDRDRYAVVFVYDENVPQGNRSMIMRQLYQLTPMEARMADLLCSGVTINEASELLRLTTETARFQVKRILSKTGVRRQAELVRLMLSLPTSPEMPRLL
ncbi:helix-turn-helix transcriptional regulator [Granulicella sp. WH15]|uniref:helix-turn-helix transcriptional regulator n=1 Tax=Granulicella sp. WH15 TaxID=2602070 RepID=UPI0013675200|nr:helix-turn-helix transcriptional regulator [Granulicella sp. WH15]QHN03789.1 helix-turn-helix transcriptional regulator [Granulicella sp. WH15]